MRVHLEFADLCRHSTKEGTERLHESHLISGRSRIIDREVMEIDADEGEARPDEVIELCGRRLHLRSASLICSQGNRERGTHDGQQALSRVLTDCHFKGRLSGVRAATTTKRDRTRDALLIALQQLLLDPDAGGVSVPQLVERAGVSQGTFYNYFDSLADAIDAVGMLLLLEHSRVLAEVVVGAADPVDVISRSAKQTLMLFAHRPDIGLLMFDSGLPVDRFLGGIRAHLLGDLQDALASGTITVTDLPVTESIYSGTMLGTCLDIYRGRLDEAAVPAIAAQLLRIIGVGARKVERLANAPQEFIQCRALPLTTIAEDQR